MRISFTVNQQPHTVEVEPRVLLVDLLRDHINLTGTKVGCDSGQCGSCVILKDGISVKSCALLGVQADGAAITTIEGISPAGTMNPLQVAFQAAHAVQCGFCTPGMIISLTDLLVTIPHPTEHQIRAWLAGNLCRCTGYENVVRAVNAAQQIAASEAHFLPMSAMRHFYDSYVGVLNGSDLTALVERYSPDAVLTTFEGIVTGHEAIRSYFEDGRMGAENAIIATEKFIEFGDSIYTESSVRTAHGLAHTYHAFVVQDGLITHQFAGVK